MAAVDLDEIMRPWFEALMDEAGRPALFDAHTHFGQNDPDFAPNGRIILFDNRITGNSPQLGYSKLLEIEPATHEVVWSYEGSDAEPFYTPIGGKVEWLPNGNILAAEPQGGRVFEVARAGGRNRIVWEYVNQLEPGRVGMVFDVQRDAPITAPWVGAACP